jgi:ATP-dependent helicase/DNAse subunit B
MVIRRNKLWYNLYKVIYLDTLNKIINHSLLVCNSQDKKEILNKLSADSKFLNLSFFNPYHSFSKVDNNYLFYLKNNFNLEPYLSERMKKYFDYIDLFSNYQNKKIIQLQRIKKSLLKDEILFANEKLYKRVYRVNNIYVPGYIKGEIIDLNINEISKNPVQIFKTKDKLEQAYFVYEKCVEILENGGLLSDIIILNSTDEDDLHLKKLFNDAQILYNIDKPVDILDFPLVKELIDILKNKSYQEAKDFLKEKAQNEVIKKVISLFNLFETSLVMDNLDIFIHLLKKQKIKFLNNANAIRICSFDDLLYQENKHYILMNYYEDNFPKKYLDNDYLSDLEVKEICYPTSNILSKNYQLMVKTLLEKIKNLTLCYPEKIIEKTNVSRLSLNRELKLIKYEYLVKNESYLNSLLYLDYAKKRFDFQNYSINTLDLSRLNNLFSDDFKAFYPYFTGINQKTLDYLLVKNNTLTPYKLETYNLCPFSYYLKYLLRLDNFETNIYAFMGNVTHKVLELNTKKVNYNIADIINAQEFPQNDAYKFSLYQEIIEENINLIKEVVGSFEELSQFKEKVPEYQINLPYDHDFTLTGKIDKVMIDNKYQYFLIIDYKYGDKNYNPEDIEKDYVLQLPFYMYCYNLAYPNLKPAGMLYQQTSIKKEERNKETDYRMKGLVIDLTSVVERIDPSLSKIVNVRITKDGEFYKNSKSIISKEKIDLLMKRIENLIHSVAKKIKQGNFEIKPILTDFDNLTHDSVSCKYCNYGSICYSKNKVLGE